MKTFAVILSGCGVYDGAEIHEAVLTLLAIDKNNCEYQIFAPDIEQYHVINHLNGEILKEKRNVLTESARIARGNIKSLKDFKVNDFDAVVFPGGFGVAKNLSDFAFKGADCEVNADVVKIVNDMVNADKTIGAMCIAPAIIAKILKNVDVTIGKEGETADNIKKSGSHHVISNHGEVVKDKKLKLFTTPCYMLDASISQIADGTDNLIKEMLKVM